MKNFLVSLGMIICLVCFIIGGRQFVSEYDVASNNIEITHNYTLT